MVQSGSLLQVSSRFATESHCFSGVFASNQCCSLSLCLSSQELLETQLWCHVSQGSFSPSPIPGSDVCLYLLPKKDESAPARSLHPALDLILREHKERLSLQTGFRLDESWK